MKSLVITFLALLTFNASASVLCHTPRMNKVFEVSDKKITFFNEFDTHAKRELASVIAKNKSEAQGITKVVDFENQKHTIHITDMNNFSDVNDYIIVKSREGHEMTYPITCEMK
ncbi:MAG: hypothetical protein H7177_07750 [Rhizobacter sp.]|nr:hypothetical protein [Bacteriovorax sp.]